MNGKRRQRKEGDSSFTLPTLSVIIIYDEENWGLKCKWATMIKTFCFLTIDR
jgi:hypothetical protein